MDDDGSKSLDIEEFKKGIHDCGLSVEPKVCVCMCLFVEREVWVWLSGLLSRSCVGRLPHARHQAAISIDVSYVNS